MTNLGYVSYHNENTPLFTFTRMAKRKRIAKTKYQGYETPAGGSVHWYSHLEKKKDILY